MLRYDIGEFAKPVITPQGYLKADALVTRVGVFKYRLLDGTIQAELRPEDEVFSKDSLASLETLIVTDDHPNVMVDSHNTKQFQVGFTGENPKKDDTFIRSKLTITNKDTIDKVLEQGKTEISSGYTADLEFTPGIFNGIKYDAVQRNIRYNHVAIVDRGRAGPDVRLRLDKDDAEMIHDKDKKQKVDNCASDKVKEKKSNFSEEKQGADLMEKVKMTIDGIEYEVPAAFAAVVRLKLDSLAGSETKISELQGAHDVLKASLEKRDVEIKEIKVKLDSKSDGKENMKIARARIDLEDFSKEVLGEESKADASDIEIKKSVLAKIQPSLDLAEKKDSYIEAAFDVCKDQHKIKAGEDKKDSDKSDDFKKSLSKEDRASVDTHEKARDNYKKDSEAAWKQDLNKL